MNENEDADMIPLDEMPQPAKADSASQGKVNAIANLTMKCYERASTLTLTEDESKRLLADFPDADFKKGAQGKENLIYIEHAALRDRLTSTLGIGQWTIVPRRTWEEEFSTRDKKRGMRVYVEAMLLVRGCFVSEAIGDMDYYPDSPGTNYGDAVEGAQTAALRRCAKNLGVGLQAWRAEWIKGWWARQGQPQQQPRPQAPAQAAAPSAPSIVPAWRVLLNPDGMTTDRLNEEIFAKFKAIPRAHAERNQVWTMILAFANENNQVYDQLPMRFVPK